MNSKMCLYLCIFIVVVVFLLYPNLNKCLETENWANTSKEIKMDVNNDGIVKVDKLRCSVDCCKFNQWPLPLELQVPESNYIGSNFSCNNGSSGGGCVCMEPKIMDTLENHSGNLVNNSCNK